jgi:lactate racemase
MKTSLDFGKTGLIVDVPDSNLLAVVDQEFESGVHDPAALVQQKICSPCGTLPLRALCKGKKTACVVVSDMTRPVPNNIILPPILKTLDLMEIRTTILIACGMHAPTEGSALDDLLGKDIVSGYRIVNHRGEDPQELVNLGTSSTGAPIIINRHYVEADLRIATGFIEPHFMAGFSGGRKAICPGISGVETMKFAHSPDLMESPFSSAGIIAGNPFHEFSLEAAHRARVDFMLNVTLNRDKRITGVFAGDLEKAHDEGVAFCSRHARVAAPAEADIVVTTGGGYPLDQDFYQTVKGMVCALPAVKQGGTIIIASECTNGIGSSSFRQLLFEMSDADSFLSMIARPGFFRIDQWEVEELIKALKKAAISLYTTGISALDCAKCRVEQVPSVERGIASALKKHGTHATITVIPSGPYVIPYTATAASI